MAEENNMREVPIYCLTKFSKDEEKLLLSALTSDESTADLLEFTEPNLVPWTGDTDGDMHTVYRDLIKKDEPKEAVFRFFFFLDRQCLVPHKDPEVIVAQPESALLLYGDDVMEECNQILREQGSTTIPEWDEQLSELVQVPLLQRALTYGRMPAKAFLSAWANLDLANMGLDELVEVEGGTVEEVRNPDWDVKAFVTEVEKAYNEREKKEASATGK